MNECTSALDSCTPTVPAYHKALVRRAKAYEQMGHFKQALSDIQKANKADTANPETQVCEHTAPSHSFYCAHQELATISLMWTYWVPGLVQAQGRLSTSHMLLRICHLLWDNACWRRLS